MKKIIYIFLFLLSINLQAVEEIQLQWEDITPPAGFTPRYIQMDDNDNMYGLLGNRIFFYEYETNNWTTQNLPVGVDINKVIDFDVDENGKAYFVIEGSSQFLIYDLNSKEISYLDLPFEINYKYYYTYKIINNKIFYSLLDNNYNPQFAHYDIHTKTNKKILTNVISKFKFDRIIKSLVINNQDIFSFPYNFEYNTIKYNNLGDFSIERKYIGYDKQGALYINNSMGNDGSTIILYKTYDDGNNWEFVADENTSYFEIFNIINEISDTNQIVFFGEKAIDQENKSLTIAIYNYNLNKIQTSKILEFGNLGITKLTNSWWGTDNIFVPTDQYIYITKNNELIVYSQEKILKTDLKKITSVENETTPSLKNLSVLYGNISENILNINIESGISSNAKISLYSSDMREIEKFSNVDFLQGKNELTFNINTPLSTGAYYVFIESGNYKHFYRIIKN